MISPQYYFTKLDEDYSPKGSRDPLGFQVLWQHQGRKLIPYLSTVSTNLHDFQIMCLAYFFYGREPDSQFVKFFLRFEQLMDYTRYDPNDNAGFNGIEGVKRNLNDSRRITISHLSKHQILSNQRAYGIWGKYNRPFQDMGLNKKSEFNTIFEEKLDLISNNTEFEVILKKVKERESHTIDLDDLVVMKPLLKFLPSERQFYIEYILRTPLHSSLQNELYDYISTQALPVNFNLYPFLLHFSQLYGKSNEQLSSILSEIEFTEKLLCPLNRIFRYLQTKPLWEKNEILRDAYIGQCKHAVDFTFHGGTEQSRIKNHFIQVLKKNNWDLALDIISRNKDVSGWRQGHEWITNNHEVLEVHLSEGGYQQPDFNPIWFANSL